MATWNAADYSRNSSQQQKWARELIAKLNLRRDERILDVGCGDGKVTFELAKCVPNGSVVGLDSSAEMVRFATESFGPPANPNLSFVEGNAASLNFSQQFDLVFSNAALHWVYDHRPVLAGIQRSLKAGGRMVAQMGGQGCAADVLRVVGEMRVSENWSKHFERFTFRYGFHGPQEYRQWMLEAGLTPNRLELILKDMTHPGREGLAGWLRTTWIPFIQAVPEADQEHFLNELLDRYLANNPIDSEGLAHVKMVRLEVEAHRAISNAKVSARQESAAMR